MSLENTITDLINPVLDDLGFINVQVRVMGGFNPTIQIMIDRKDEKLTTVDDCATASRAISAMMDVEDPVSNAYTLEVSTPGIDRPLVSLRDFERYTTQLVKIECQTPIASKRKVRGFITGIDGDAIILEQDNSSGSLADDELNITIDLDNIKLAKLVMNDSLVEFSRTLYNVTDDEQNGTDA